MAMRGDLRRARLRQGGAPQAPETYRAPTSDDWRRGYSIKRATSVVDAMPDVVMHSEADKGGHTTGEQATLRSHMIAGIARSRVPAEDLEGLERVNVSKVGHTPQSMDIVRWSNNDTLGVYHPEWSGTRGQWNYANEAYQHLAKVEAGTETRDTFKPKPSFEDPRPMSRPAMIDIHQSPNHRFPSNTATGTLIHEIGHHATQHLIFRNPQVLNSPLNDVESGASEAYAENYRFQRASNASTGGSVFDNTYDESLGQQHDVRGFAYQATREGQGRVGSNLPHIMLEDLQNRAAHSKFYLPDSRQSRSRLRAHMRSRKK